MVVNEMPAKDFEHTFELLLAHDERVKSEFDQLNQLLAEINAHPVAEHETQSDPTWRINDYEVSRWHIVVEGNTRLDRIAQFRRDLQTREDIIDARVESFNDGQISIRIVTTGGIPMGPLERAVSSLTRGEAQISQAD